MNLNLRPNLVAAISSGLGVSVLVITDYLTKNHEYEYHHGNTHRSKRDILLNSLGLKTDIRHHIQPNEILHSVEINDEIDVLDRGPTACDALCFCNLLRSGGRQLGFWLSGVQRK